MNLDALKYILKNRIELIEEIVAGTQYDASATVGVGNFLLANEGNLELLSQAQKYHYKEFIKPFIESVTCEGVFGNGTCTGNGYIDDESLIACYIEDEFLCQHCRYDAERITAD